MRFEINICLLSVLSIIAQIISDSSQSATNGLQATDLDQSVLKDGLTTVNDTNSTNRRISKVLKCFVNLSDKGSEATRNECHDAFSSIWISARHLLLGDDNEIGGICTAGKILFSLIPPTKKILLFIFVFFSRIRCLMMIVTIINNYMTNIKLLTLNYIQFLHTIY
jgi:hypothetical protein